jgi:NAD-dependent deacetylase
MNALDIFRGWVLESHRIVFFGGAGVSTESGIPDFRSVDGLYHQKYRYPPETILSATFFHRNPQEFYEFYRNKLLPGNVKPNKAHLKLAQLEEEGRLSAVVTQNIDGLHHAAGSKNVFELHGTVYKNHCTRCGKFFPLEYVRDCAGVPRCDCGGIIKPDVVLYEENLNEEVMYGAISAIMDADLLIVGGTSLSVYPAAGMIDAYHGARMVLINKSETGRDGRANLIFREPIGELLSQI